MEGDYQATLLSELTDAQNALEDAARILAEDSLRGNDHAHEAVVKVTRARQHVSHVIGALRSAAR